MFITQKHISRRTALKGLGVTMALPFLEAMVPAGAAGEGGDGEGAPGGHRDGARLGRRHGDWRQEVPVVAGGDRVGVRSEPEQSRAARAVPRAPHDHQQHRRAQRRSVHAAGDWRRPFPRQRGLPHPGPSQADAGLRRPRGDVARSALRAEVRPGHADSLDAALHRERGPGRRLRLRLLVRLHRHGELGIADRAAADGPRSARGVRHAVRRRRHARAARRAAARRQEHPRLDHRGGRAAEGQPGSRGPRPAGRLSR